MEVLDLTSGQKSVFQYNEWINKEKPRCELAPISQEVRAQQLAVACHHVVWPPSWALAGVAAVVACWHAVEDGRWCTPGKGALSAHA